MEVLIGWVVYGLIVLVWIALWRWRKRSVAARGRLPSPRVSNPPSMTERQFLVAIIAKLEQNMAYYQQTIDHYSPAPAPLDVVRGHATTAEKLAGYRAQLAVLEAPTDAAGIAQGGQATDEGGEQKMAGKRFTQEGV